ncbi:MAG TPA: GNAT family N-acetyltransferase [Microlunatus sp.]|nr:GNAT family N-acetyltransferase [Microlunatus sp.]
MTELHAPADVPVLSDPRRGVRLRAHRLDDLEAIVEQCNDAESIRFTTVPTPYDLGDARAFVTEVVATGWRDGTTLAWAIEWQAPAGPAFGGSIDLRLGPDGTAEVGFGLHPAARGRGVMSAALRLIRDYAFDVRGLQVLRWRAVIGNWASRKVAASAGFRFDGSVRRLLHHRGDLLDGWVGTLTADDPREPRTWLEPPVLIGDRVRLRPFGDRDLPRLAEAAGDPRTAHWLVSLPQPYTLDDAWDFVESGRELAARGQGLSWCIADAGTDRCVGTIGLDSYASYARRGEIGYWAHPDARGRGLVTEAARLVTGYGARSGLVRFLQIRCAAGNAASRHVAEAAGYTQVGVLPAAEPVRSAPPEDLIVYAFGLPEPTRSAGLSAV